MKPLFAASAAIILTLTCAAHAGQVTEAKLGREVVDRTLTEEVKAFKVQERAYLWMKVEDAANETLTVTWKVKDLAFPTEVKIGGSPWRTWASKTLHVAGDWSVTVTDTAGKTLHESRFTAQ